VTAPSDIPSAGPEAAPPPGGTDGRERLGAAFRRRLWSPPAHWWLLGLCLGVVCVLLAFQGFVTHTIGATAEPPVSPTAAAPLEGSRPLLAAHGDTLRSPQPPPGKRIALTFDDGPDPTWTPRILDVLTAEGVRGTFFMVGSQAAQHPGVVREVVRAGGEIGNHTFTHTSLSTGPS
jgi:hypothetical protein